MRRAVVHLVLLIVTSSPCWGADTPAESAEAPVYDLLIRNGAVYDGSGSAPFLGDVAVLGDSIAAVGAGLPGRGRAEIDAEGLAVAPGFINMLSWAPETLLVDGRSQSDIRQGVTLEVMGEGVSMGPLSEAMKKAKPEKRGPLEYEVAWTTLGEYLEHLVERGVSTNVASFVGATTVRINVLGYQRRDPTAQELQRMKELVRHAMEEGAMGLSTALVYAPASYAKTREIVELAKVAAEYGGMYISHMRSERDAILRALDELIQIAREAGIRAEIYHLKVPGDEGTERLDQVLEKVEEARRAGLAITADMYLYTASATSLDSLLPNWIHEGGQISLLKRLKNAKTRKRLLQEMKIRRPENIRIMGLKGSAFREMSGKDLVEIASRRRTTPEEAVLDLIVEEPERVKMVRFSMSEENIRRQIALPWMSFGSDGGSMAPEGVFLELHTHPRAYGNFARLLGKYVRDEKVILLEEAVRRLTSLPAANLQLERRGAIKPGYYADLAIFDPARVQDHATYDEPHRYATGMVHVFVNGVQVLRDGEHTGAKPGRVVRGPGWKGKEGGRASRDAGDPARP